MAEGAIETDLTQIQCCIHQGLPDTRWCSGDTGADQLRGNGTDMGCRHGGAIEEPVAPDTIAHFGFLQNTVIITVVIDIIGGAAGGD